MIGSAIPSTYFAQGIQPLGQGGSNEVENLQALCPHCHRVKTLEELQQVIADSLGYELVGHRMELYGVLKETIKK